MSVTMSKANGVTVLTLNSDPESACPPLCQIFKSLCYSPVCCSLSQHLRRVQGTSQSALGALQIMVGLLSIGLVAILASGGSNYGYVWWFFTRTIFPSLFGGLFIIFGTVSILSEKFPSPCLVIVSVILNLAGVAFAIAAIEINSVDLPMIRFLDICDYGYDYGYQYRYRYRYQMTTVTPPPEKPIMKQRCLEGQALIYMLLRSIDSVLIVLSVLELCLVVSSVVMGIKALRTSGKGENENTNQHLEDVTTNPEV